MAEYRSCRRVGSTSSCTLRSGGKVLSPCKPVYRADVDLWQAGNDYFRWEGEVTQHELDYMEAACWRAKAYVRAYQKRIEANPALEELLMTWYPDDAKRRDWIRKQVWAIEDAEK